MGNEDIPEIDSEKIKSEMRIIIDRIKKNENRVNKAIKYRIQDINYDFGVSQISDKELLSEYYFSVGMGYQLLNGKENKIKALEFLQQAEDIVDKEDIARIYEVYNEIGIALYMIAKYNQASKYYNKALDLANNNNLDNNKKSSILVNIASINTIKQNYEDAIDQLRMSLKLYIDDSITIYPEESKTYLGKIYFNIASNYLHLLDLEEALENFRLGHEFVEYPEYLKKNIELVISQIYNETEGEDDKYIELIVKEIKGLP